MINLENILNTIILTLNKANLGGRFIKDFNLHNKPPYPYTTINITTPYIPQTFRPEIEQKYDAQKDKVVYSRKEQAQTLLSFNIYGKDRTSAYQLVSDTIGALKFSEYDTLANSDIIVLEVSGIRDLTGILVTDYEYRFQFDLRVRVPSLIEKEVDYAKKIIIKDETLDKEIEIKE